MEHGAVLDAGFGADGDVIHVTTDGHMGPDAGALAHDDVADDDGAGVDVSGDSDAGSGAAKRTNHVAGIDFMLTRGVERHFVRAGAAGVRAGVERNDYCTRTGKTWLTDRHG